MIRMSQKGAVAFVGVLYADIVEIPKKQIIHFVLHIPVKNANILLLLIIFHHVNF